MSNTQNPATKSHQQPKRRNYNPAPLPRKTRLTEIDPAQVAHFAVYSYTRKGKEIEHHPAVDLQTGACRCTCEDFTFKKAMRNPNVWSDDSLLCKHLRRALKVLEKHRYLPQQHGQFTPPCIKCGVMDADDYFEAMDSTGNVVIGHICHACIEASMDDLSDAAPEYPTALCAYRAPEPLTAADRYEQDAYYDAMDAAESYAAYVEQCAQVEAAEMEESDVNI